MSELKDNSDTGQGAPAAAAAAAAAATDNISKDQEQDLLLPPHPPDENGHSLPVAYPHNHTPNDHNITNAEPEPQRDPKSESESEAEAEVHLDETAVQPIADVKTQVYVQQKAAGDGDGDEEYTDTLSPHKTATSTIESPVVKSELPKDDHNAMELVPATADQHPNSNHSFLWGLHSCDGDDSGSEEDQAAFMKELENFFRERTMEFKPPKFYGEGLNCLKLWRAVTRLGGYDKVTSCKLWRQVGESFKPPKTCTTVSWTFRIFYEKALLDYERHKIRGGELSIPVASLAEPMNVENSAGGNQASGSGRARRDAAARAMQGWHSQRLLGNGEVGDPIIKDKNALSIQKREKQLKSIGLLKRKKPPNLEHAVKAARTKAAKPQLDTTVVDIGPPADWVKINVRRTKDCFEVYALVPGLLREEVRVQSDPAGRLVITGEPEHPDNPWGVTPFKKVVSLPSRIDPHQTSAVVTLHGQLFVRVPFEQSD